MAADLAQASERGEDMHFALREAVLADGLHDLLAAAAEFGQIELALIFAKRAIAALFDTIRKIFRDLFLQAAQHDRPQLRGKPFACDFLAELGVLALGFVRL